MADENKEAINLTPKVKKYLEEQINAAREETKKQMTKDFEAKLETSRKGWEQEQTNNSFLKSIPEANKNLAKDLIAAGKTPAYIKANYPTVLQDPNDNRPLNLKSVLEPTPDKGSKPAESDEAFEKRVKENGIKPENKADWDRYFKLKNKEK